MQQKSKLILATLSIVAFLGVGFVLFHNSSSTIPVANAPRPIPGPNPDIPPKSIRTTSPITGDKSIDSSINSILNDSLSEDNLDKEFTDTDLDLSADEENLNQINNLSNEDIL